MNDFREALSGGYDAGGKNAMDKKINVEKKEFLEDQVKREGEIWFMITFYSQFCVDFDNYLMG